MKDFLTQIKTCTTDCNWFAKIFIATLGVIVTYGVIAAVILSFTSANVF